MAATVAKLNTKSQNVEVGRSLTRLAMRRIRRDRLTLIALGFIIVLTALCFVGAPLISNALGVSYSRTNADETFIQPGTPGHILGTDDLGRDVLSRLLYAGQVSLSVGFIAAVLAISIGVSLGILTGYYGGIVDDVVNWVIATLDSIPSLFLLLIVAAVLKPGPATLIIILGLLGWTGTTRLVRGETLSLREREYILSARAVGASPWRIMFAHVLPNLISLIVITLAIDIGSLILVEAALSYLGLGIKAPTPEWGNMLTDGQTYFTKGQYLVILPGLLIFLTVLCLYVIGDGVRDAFDPQAKD